jgi:DNA-directed RNA polymerase subunit K/omega
MLDTDLDALAKKVGGRFRLCTLVLKRARAKLMSHGGATERLNSQVIREILKEVEDGRLNLLDMEGAAPPTEGAKALPS